MNAIVIFSLFVFAYLYDIAEFERCKLKKNIYHMSSQRKIHKDLIGSTVGLNNHHIYQSANTKFVISDRLENGSAGKMNCPKT